MSEDPERQRRRQDLVKEKEKLSKAQVSLIATPEDDVHMKMST
jgi:hypothetical protein